MLRLPFPLRLSKNTQVVACSIVICFCTGMTSAWSVPPSPAGGNYLALDGEDDYAVLDFDTFGMLFDEGTSEVTVEAWVYPTLEPEEDEDAVILRQQVAIWTVNSHNPGYQNVIKTLRPGLKTDDLILAMKVRITCGGIGGASPGTMFLTLSPYQWHHVAFQLEQREEIWAIAWICDDICSSKPWGWPGTAIDGDLSWLVNQNVIPHQGFVVGGYGGKFADQGSFAGYVDEVRISTAPRYDITREEITPQGRFEQDADTVALWHFDERSGAEIFRDSSGNEYHLVGKNGAAIRVPLAVDRRNKLATVWANIKME